MCQCVCCGCWWVNCWGACCSGCHTAYCCYMCWICPPDGIECCLCMKCTGIGANCLCVGDVCCAPEYLRAWSANQGVVQKESPAIVINNSNQGGNIVVDQRTPMMGNQMAPYGMSQPNGYQGNPNQGQTMGQGYPGNQMMYGGLKMEREARKARKEKRTEPSSPNCRVMRE